MNRMINRRALLLASGSAAIAMIIQTGAAQPASVSGTVTYAGKKAIPEGHIEIYLEDPAAPDAGEEAAKAQLESDGGSRAIEFSYPLPASARISPTLQIIARLERSDGWLLARGSAKVKAGKPVEIMLNTVMY